MSTSWRSPFPILPAPQTTPVSTNPKSLRRPIHNPYDKFTKPEFDDWIGGITSALRRALGEETQEDADLDEHRSQDVNAAAEETFSDQSFEDSFADIQSRRAKGKAKDPREGSGLGAQQNPIELLSDSESGAESEEEYEGFSAIEGEGFDIEEEGEGHDSHPEAGNWTINRRHSFVDPFENNEVEEILSREESPDIIEICSDEEEDTRAPAHEAGFSGRQYAQSSQLPPNEVEDELGPNGSVLYEQEGQLGAEEIEDFPPSIAQHQPSLSPELPDPWQGTRTYAEDFYTGGDFNVQDQLNDVSPSSLTPVHDAHVHTFISNIVQNDGPPSGLPRTEPAVVNVDTDEVLPDSSPPPSSPVDVRSSLSHVGDYQFSNVRGTHGEHEDPENILDHLYRDAESLSQDEHQMGFASSFDEFHSGSMSASQAYSKPTEHLDWNWPPAFPRGKFASRAGHLETSSPRSGVDDIEEAQDDVIDVDAEHVEEDGSEEAPEGPLPLGTSDLGYGDEIHQDKDGQSDDQNELGVEFVEETDIQASEADEFPLSLNSQLNADERAAVESFFDLLNNGGLPSANVTEQVETTLVDISGMVTAEFIDGNATFPPGIEKAGGIMVPPEVLEPGDREIQSQHPNVMVESSTLIEPTPATEIRNGFENVTLENVEHHPSALGDSLKEQPDKPNVKPICIVVEMEATASIPRGVSEGIEVASYAGDVSDPDGEYVVEEPPTTEASVEPEVQATGQVNVLGETVPVTAKPASAELSSSDNHNISVFPMPIFCDPSVSDPIISSGTKHPQLTPPCSAKLSGTPHIIISPHSTPGQPTPVSVPVSTSILHTFSRRESPSEGSSGPSGLFTPREGEPTSVDTGDIFGTPSPSHTDVPPPSSDDVVASVTSALAEESRSEIAIPVIDVSDNVTVVEPSPTETSTGNEEDDRSELVEVQQLGVFHPSSVDADAENRTAQPPTKPAAGHSSVTENITVASLEPEEVQQTAGSTPPTTDRTPASDHDNAEEASASATDAEAPPAEVPEPADSPLPSPLSEQEPLPSLAPGRLVSPQFVREPGQDNSQEYTVSKYPLKHVPDTAHESPDVHEPRESGVAEDKESQTKPSKRKRVSPVQTSSRLTRSMSSGHKKFQGDHKVMRIVPGRSRKRKLLDSGSDHGSASSGASTVAKLLQFTSANGSRASSIVSSAPSDSSSIQQPPPLFHTHGTMHHRHRPPPLPSVSVQTHKAKTVSPEPSHNHEREKDYFSVSALSRAPSSNIQRLAALTSSPVTRSNCRFHKISLPKEEGGPRVCFVVPGCSLGDKELMDEEEIQDHGPATYEDYSRLVGNIEALDFNPYLVGILRQLVGVDLIRENEVFFLPQPGEEARYKKTSRKSTAGLKHAASLSQSATTSPQVSVASRRSPVMSISRPPVSTAGSIATSYSSSLSEAQLSKHASSLFSASGEELSDEEGSSPKLKRRRKESISDKETRVNVEGDNVPSKGSQRSTHILKWRRSKRQDVDSAAYKPHAENVEGSDSGADGIGKDRRKMKMKQRNKRSRAADEEQDSQSKRQKQVPNE
ncbi:uncharacterized protein EDB93DRAFT_446039 [Suillus bovinus]|uniref:uncharacterized protein n=1 Tax=Suillus bovinus TaxID=48563 RepID=UPI001B85E1D7|nr:uncharacterized protein EDB93DRAFT_446039 [Suillus bovinus]KAG2159131.1 hypothetical protein EDB93DRAFT_446039 [Suillus bovinus]